LWGLFSLVLWRTTRTYRDFPWRKSRLIKRSFHHRLWRLPYTEVLVCHKQRVKVFHSNLSIERSWVPFRCWVSLFLTGFTSFGIKAQFLVQVCLSFNIFHSCVSSLAVHIICLFLAEFPLSYLFNLCLSCWCLNYWSGLTSLNYFEILFHYSQKLVADHQKKKRKKKRERNSKKNTERSPKKKLIIIIIIIINFTLLCFQNSKLPYSF
jgi:hypothetical protein